MTVPYLQRPPTGRTRTGTGSRSRCDSNLFIFSVPNASPTHVLPPPLRSRSPFHGIQTRRASHSNHRPACVCFSATPRLPTPDMSHGIARRHPLASISRLDRRGLAHRQIGELFISLPPLPPHIHPPHIHHGAHKEQSLPHVTHRFPLLHRMHADIPPASTTDGASPPKRT